MVLNLPFNVLNGPPAVSHFSCLHCVSVSNNCNPFLPSHFFIIDIFSVSGVLCDLNILFTSRVKFFSSLYFSSVSQLNVGCFSMGMPTLGPTFCLVLFSELAAGMTCNTAFISLAVTCVTLICHLLYFMLAYVCLYKTMIVFVCLFEICLLMFAYLQPSLLTPCGVSCLKLASVKRTLYVYMHIFLPLCASIRI